MRSFLRFSMSGIRSLAALFQNFVAGMGSATLFGVDRPKHFVRGDFDKIRVLVFDFIDSGLDVLHIIDIFDQAFFAGGDDQALLAVHERDLGDFLDGHEAQIVLGRGADIDERAQAIVLAEIAARSFVARGAVFDLADSLKPDEGSLLAVAPQTQGLDCSADSAGFAADIRER